MKPSHLIDVPCMTLILVVLCALPAWAAKCSSDPLSPGVYFYTVDDRSVLVRVPLGYSDERATPVLFDLHGAGLNGQAEALVSGFWALCDERGFIGVWPSGVRGTWNYALNDPSSDAGYIRRVVDKIRSVANVDRSRVYVVGVSQGGAMTNTLACEAADVFAAAAPDSMQLGVAADQCRPSRPVSIMEWHGYEDSLIPYYGGTSVPVPGGAAVTVPSAPESVLKWAQIMGCSGDPVETSPPDGTGVVQTYTTCSGGMEVGLGSIHGDHGLYAQFGLQEYTWSFLTRFALPLTAAQLDECPEGSSTPDDGSRSGGAGQEADPPSIAVDPGGDTDSGGGGCFIATAAYGSFLDHHVAVLRAFRDKYLVTNGPGRILVRFYYRHSPPVAALMERHGYARTAARAVLAPLVCGLEHPFAALLMVASASASVFIVLGRRRRVRGG